jgi:hypothetical protein
MLYKLRTWDGLIKLLNDIQNGFGGQPIHLSKG